MPRELITIQVGQCGNQIGTTFWEMALKEHAAALAEHTAPGTTPIFDEAMTSFFRNVKSNNRGESTEFPYNPLHPTPIYSLRARAVCIDMEEGVLNQIKKSPLGDLFETNQYVRSVSGAGNNWAHGYCEYGPQYTEEILESVRAVAERCDSLQSFFVMSSAGGGTGSGLGSYLLHVLADAFPHVYRFNTTVVPAEDDDVVTSPYNSVLALEQMREFSDCVLPIDNQALLHMARKSLLASGMEPNPDQHPYQEMNEIVGQVLTSLTAPIRFSGPLNVDLNELTMNLVPYPSLHFIVSSIAPITPSSVLAAPSSTHAHKHSSSSSSSSALLGTAPRHLDQLFTDVLRPEHCLLSVELREATYLSLGLFTRGVNIHISDVQRNVQKLRGILNMAEWNTDGFKIGLCNQRALNCETSVLALSNSTAITQLFKRMRHRFNLLYRRKAHIHHYTQYCEMEVFEQAKLGLNTLIHDYTKAATNSTSMNTLYERLEPI